VTPFRATAIPATAIPATAIPVAWSGWVGARGSIRTP